MWLLRSVIRLHEQLSHELRKKCEDTAQWNEKKLISLQWLTWVGSLNILAVFRYCSQTAFKLFQSTKSRSLQVIYRQVLNHFAFCPYSRKFKAFTGLLNSNDLNLNCFCFHHDFSFLFRRNELKTVWYGSNSNRKTILALLNQWKK